MRKIVVYIIILCALSACVTYDRTTEQVAETTLRTADSLEYALQTYADLIALQDAAETFRAKGQTAKEAKVLYHLGKAYLAGQQDSLAFECFSQAANEFLREFSELARRDYAKLPIRVLGPSPATVIKVSNKYRYKLIIKCRNTRQFRRLLSSVLISFSGNREYAKITAYADMNAPVC